MIVDATVLQAEFQPQEIVLREGEIDHLTAILDPILDGDRVTGAFVHGPPGAGKTCVSKFITAQLEEQSLDVSTACVDCWDNNTEGAVLHRLLKDAGQYATVSRQSTPKDELAATLRESTDSPFVVVLDEIDQLRDDTVLHTLYEIPALTTILIANRERDFFADLDSRVSSRYGSVPRIQFQRYHDHELVSILTHRVDAGLQPGAIGVPQLRAIADAAAGRTAARADDRTVPGVVGADVGTVHTGTHSRGRRGSESPAHPFRHPAGPKTRAQIEYPSVRSTTPQRLPERRVPRPVPRRRS